MRRLRVASMLLAGVLAPENRADAPSASEPIELVADVESPASQLPAQPALAEQERPLPINLSTTLRLAGARPAAIEIANHAMDAECARWRRAKVLWLPNLYLGMDYQRNDGGFQTPEGTVPAVSRNQMLLGLGATATFALTDAIYEPLAARQLVQARQFEVEAARNDSCFAAAEAFFAVQAARGRLAGAIDAASKARTLEASVRGLTAGIAAAMEIDRARATRLALEQAVVSAREDWAVASARLVRVLRLDPATTAVPQESPEFRIDLALGDRAVDELLAKAASARPELGSLRSQAAAAATRVQQEKHRPLIPTLVVQGNSSPNQRLAGGFYGTGVNSSVNDWTGRSAWDAQVVWEFRNLGLGNRAAVDERQAQRRLATAEFARSQEAIAAEVVQAKARLASAAARVAQSQEGLEAAAQSFDANARGMRETMRTGEMLRLVVRPQEAISALIQLQAAYVSFYAATAEFNTAQYGLQRALGIAAVGK